MKKEIKPPRDKDLFDITSVIGFDGSGNARQFADYNQWLNSLSVKKKKTADKPHKAKTKSRKLTYKEQLEPGKIEEMILKAEEEVAMHQVQVQDPGIMADSERLQECCRQLQTAQEKVEALYSRWEELETIRSDSSQS